MSKDPKKLATLRAAAPDMLAALREVLDHLYTKQDMDRVKEIARAAIAKAGPDA